jgi:hypothetical protein
VDPPENPRGWAARQRFERARNLDALVCAICVLLLVGWARHCRSQMQARKRRQPTHGV